jgi:hypothetical protein
LLSAAIDRIIRFFSPERGIISKVRAFAKKWSRIRKAIEPHRAV